MPRPMIVRQAIIDGRGSRLRCRDRGGHRLDVVPVDLDHVPVGDAKARGNVLADRQRRAAVVGDAVVVPEQDKLAQPQVPGERDHLLADAFLQAAVADEGVGVVVDQAGAEAGIEVCLGDRHAERVGDALAERAGRDLDAAGRIELRMAFAVRAELAEALDLRRA